MNTAIEVKKISREKDADVVIVSRKEYESLLGKQRFIPIARLTLAEKRALEKSRKEMAKGDYLTLSELKNDLGIANRKKR